MAIVVDRETRLVVQGLTGSEGRFHGLRNRAYGTDVVAGVTPGKGGQDVEGIPVFDTVAEAVEETGANTSMVFVPARFAADAEVIVTVGDGCVRAVRPRPGGVARTASRLGWPVGDLSGIEAGELLADAHPDDVLARWRVAVAIELVGSMSGALDLTVAHVSERKQFGRPIGSYQAVSHRCAQMLLETESARSATYYAAWAADNQPEIAELTASMAKAYASDAGTRVTGASLQVHGGIGFTWEHDLHLWLKRASADAAMFGDARWHRERVARMVIDGAGAQAHAPQEALTAAK